MTRSLITTIAIIALVAAGGLAAALSTASGLLLVIIGVLVASGELQRVTLQLSSGEFADFSLALEDRVLDALVGLQE